MQALNDILVVPRIQETVHSLPVVVMSCLVLISFALLGIHDAQAGASPRTTPHCSQHKEDQYEKGFLVPHQPGYSREQGVQHDRHHSLCSHEAYRCISHHLRREPPPLLWVYKECCCQDGGSEKQIGDVPRPVHALLAAYAAHRALLILVCRAWLRAMWLKHSRWSRLGRPAYTSCRPAC